MKKLIEYFQIPKHLALAVVVISAVTLAAAYTSQYGFGLKPCNLCLYQRVPYFFNIDLGFLAFLATFRYPRLAKMLLSLTVVIFFAGAVIAGFHVGVEQKWWEGLPTCSGGILPQNASIEELRKSLTQQEIVRCDIPQFVLFGISMAGYNFLLSLALGFGVTYQLRKKP